MNMDFALWKSLILLLVMELFSFVIGFEPPTNGCDWIIWDNTKQPAGVRNIAAQCSEGHIEWEHPYGAIRLLLQLGSRASTFEACFIVKSQYTNVKISLEDDASDSLFNLVTLHSASQSYMEKELCFKSTGKAVKVYLEAQMDIHATTIGLVEVDYDIVRQFPKVDYNEMDDCRPCSAEEMIQAVCSSDFVVQGSISQLLHHPHLDESHLHLNIDKVFRQKSGIFQRQVLTSTRASRTSLKFSKDTKSNSNMITNRTDGYVIMPHKCGIKHGQGEFLFLGRVRLKKALLKCAPRVDDFRQIWAKAIATGQNWCVMD